MSNFKYQSKANTLGRDAEILQIAWRKMGDWEKRNLIDSLELDEPDFLSLIVNKEIFLRDEGYFD